MGIRRWWFQNRKTILDPIAWWLSKAELRRCMQRCGTDPMEVLNCAQTYVGRGYYQGLRPFQEPLEILALARLVQSRHPKCIVEIGTAKGGTLFVWCRTNPEAEKIVSIDLPGGPYGGGYDRRREKLYKEMVSDRPQMPLFLLRADSHSPQTLDKVRKILAGNLIDFLFIDGDHTYQGVSQDFHLYAPLVRQGGIIALHDIRTRDQNSASYGVSRFWEEQRVMFRHMEFAERENLYGIGVLFA